jgi:ferredoxin--NADP+ reductase
MENDAYNAAVRIVYRDNMKMVFRVYPDGVKMTYKAGQYGALGLRVEHPRIDGLPSCADRDHGTLIKRPYSLSSSILDESGQPIGPEKTDYYEFYVDLVSADEVSKPRLSARLFTLKDHDRIFMGHKIVGHYTLEACRDKSKILFMGTTTAEAPHNAMIAEILREKNSRQITHVVAGPQGWKSAYVQTHEEMMKRFLNYRFICIEDDERYTQMTRWLREILSDQNLSIRECGWGVDPRDTHVYLCGDPLMIGAPRKLGAWQYEYPQEGLMPLLGTYGFHPGSRFQQGHMSYEGYW